MAHSVLCSRRAHRLVIAALSASAAFLPGVAWADCTLSGSTITCPTGSNASYSNTAASNVTVNVAGTVSAPLVIGTASGAGTLATPNILNNSGTIAGTGAVFSVQFGDYATINNGSSSLHTVSITSSGAVSGAGAIRVGDHGTVNNFGTITAAAGTPAVKFGAAGTFNNDATAPAVVSGDIIFGQTTGVGNTSTFNNANTAFGLTGSVGAAGNITLTNAGLWTGSFVQTTVGASGVVSFVNGDSGHLLATGMSFAGIFATQDVTTLTNYGSMFLYAGSGIGTAQTGTSTVTNNGTLTIGNGSSAAAVTINGNFVQGSTGTLGLIVLPSGVSVATAGSSFSQLNTVGGSMSLNGTLALNITPGFYPTGSVYQLLTADQGITGNFSTITGAVLPFIKFVPVGCTFGGGSPTCTQSGTTITPTGTAGIVYTTSAVTPGSPQAYEFTVARTATYHDALVTAGVGSTPSVVTTNQLAIAHGLMPTISTGLVKTANDAVTANNLTSDAIAFVGAIDVLTIAQAQTFLDSVSPEGYLAYKTAQHDQANAFTRSVALRMDDQNSPHDEDGWWFNVQGEYEMKSQADHSTGYRTRDNLIGFLGGYDFSGPHHVYGLAMNLSWDALSYAPGSLKGHNRDIAFAGYGAYDFGPLVVSGQVAYNLGHLGANKTITLGSLTRSAHASASESLLKATGTVGLKVVTGDFKLEPFAGIEYANGSVSGFTETGAGTASNLTVAKMNADRTDLIAGVSFSRSAGVFRPYLRAVYRSQIGSGGGNSISAYFDADPSTTFTGVAEARHEIDANAGVNWVFDDAGALFVGAQATSRTGHTSVGLNFGVRLEF